MDLNLLTLKHTKLHFPVLIREVLSLLSNINGVVVDCTFGAGGYSEFILKYTKATVIAIDRDINTQQYASYLKEKYPEKFFFINDKFSNIDKILQSLKISLVDVVIADLGVSTMQLKEKDRGFSFQSEAPLSMTMGLNNFDAKFFINNAKEENISKVIWEYGEEAKSKQIAKAIVLARAKEPINTTKQLSDIIHKVLKNRVNKKGKDVSTKTFQAIRIHTNDELLELINMLNKLPYLLKYGGKIVIVSFHSLEDRIVKRFFNDLTNYNFNSYDNNYNIFRPQQPMLNTEFKLLTKKAIKPQEDEIKINKSSSSAKLRAIKKFNKG